MARIHPELIKKIGAKQSIGQSAVYTQIQKVHNETLLERDLAALELARRCGIGITRYSTLAQRQELQLRLAGGAAFAAAPPSPAPTSPPRAARGKSAKPARKKDNSVFVIGGRDTALTESMYALLSALGCKPVEFHQAVRRARGKSNNPFIGQVLEDVFGQMDALVVIFSPDDDAKLKDQFLKPSETNIEGRLRGQARPNVIFEAGMAMGAHPEKTIKVQVGEMKGFSDIAGRHMVHLGDSYASRSDFAQRLGKLCKIDMTGSRWTEVGSFVPATAAPKPTRKKTKARGAAK